MVIDDHHPFAAPVLFQPNLIASSWRDQFAFYMDFSGLSRKWELFDATVNLAFCILYMWNTSYPRLGMPSSNRWADFVLALILFLQFLPRLYCAVGFLRSLFSFMTILTLLSCLPVFLAFLWNDQEVKDSYMSAGAFVYVYPFRFLRLHQSIMACLVPTKKSIVKLSLISRKVIHLFGFLVFLVLTVAAFVHIFQYKLEKNRITFFDALFFVIGKPTLREIRLLIPA